MLPSQIIQLFFSWRCSGDGARAGETLKNGAQQNKPHIHTTAGSFPASFDERISAVLHDVPIPEGIVGRLVERISDNNGTIATNSEGASRGWFQSRRKILMGVGCAVAASLVFAVAAMSLSPSDSEVSTELLPQLAGAWLDQIAPGIDWRHDAIDNTDYYITRAIQARAMGWQMWSNDQGQEGIVFRLQGPNRNDGYLLVLRGRGRELPDRPPMSPQFRTGGRIGAMWLEGDVVFALVMHGNVDDYRSMVAPNLQVA